MKSIWQHKGGILFLLALVFRLPFLGEGYGREFDAWSNILNAKILSETGVYEVSRLPGHPLQELIYSLIWSLTESPYPFNLLTALFSAWAVYSVYHILCWYKVERSFEWALAFNFIPVFFIASTSAIDYNFALAFIVAAFLQFLKGRYALAGLLIGLATGFRISSIGFLAPIVLILPYRQWLKAWPMLVVALLSSVSAYLMPYLTYGWEFLDFHKPPFPGWASVLYKLGLGIWGLPLLLALAISLPNFFKKVKLKSLAKGFSLEIVLLLIIAMQLLVFLRLPFKAEFFIPALPFVILLWALRAPKCLSKYIHYLALSSLLFFGFDYADPYRGAEPLDSATYFEAGSKTLFMSPFQGPLSIDQSKRRVKSNTVNRAISKLKELEEPVCLVAGWYWPELQLKLGESVHYVDHYSTEEELRSAQKAGLRILYLPEIDQQNALMHEGVHLQAYGEPLL